MMIKMGFFAILLMSISSVVASASLDTEATPNDGQDDSAVIQAEIDKLWKSGGGTLTLDKGVYDMSTPLYLRTDVVVTGAGNETILSNESLNDSSTWRGTTVFAGNVAPAVFMNNDGIGATGHLFSMTGPNTVEISACDEIPMGIPSTGRIVWLASDSHKTGRGGFARPELGEMNLVDSVQFCQITLQEKVSEGILPGKIYWENGDVAVHRGLQVNRPIRHATLTNLTLKSKNGQALIVSGCFECTLSNIVIGKSRRLLAVQGSRNSNFTNITGSFTERGIEVAMFASDNQISDIAARYDGSSERSPRPAVRFGEFATRNHLSDVSLDVSELKSNAILIRFDESTNNVLDNIKFLATDKKRSYKQVVYRGQLGLRDNYRSLPPGTELNNIRICQEFDECLDFK